MLSDGIRFEFDDEQPHFKANRKRARLRNQNRNLLDGSEQATGTRELRRPPAVSPTCGGGTQFPP
jgi:hypothetical protein